MISHGQSYLLLKATAGRLPLRNNSVNLVIATPPYFGHPHTRGGEYGTSNSKDYDRSIKKFLAEAGRVVKPDGYVLLNSAMRTNGRARRATLIVFRVWQKRHRNGRLRHPVRAQTFPKYFIGLENFRWYALSVRLYQTLIRRYSRCGDIVAHVFSGSGNGGIAALKLARKPVLIDLHYHRQVRRRLNQGIYPDGLR